MKSSNKKTWVDLTKLQRIEIDYTFVRLKGHKVGPLPLFYWHFDEGYYEGLDLSRFSIATLKKLLIYIQASYPNVQFDKDAADFIRLSRREIMQKRVAIADKEPGMRTGLSALTWEGTLEAAQNFWHTSKRELLALGILAVLLAVILFTAH